MQGEAALRRAAEAAPDDPEVRELLAKHGVSAAPKPPPPPPVPVAPRVAARPPPPAAPRPAAPEHSDTGEIRITEETPSPTPVPSSRNVAYSEQLADKYATREFTLSTPAGKAKRRGKGHKLLFTVGLAFVLVAALGGWFLFNRARKATIEGIDRLLKETVPLVEKDAYAGVRRRRREVQARSWTSTTPPSRATRTSRTSTRSGRASTATATR